jgi:valyl-tRNA synthetase
MDNIFPKTYNPLSVEDKWYDLWQNNKIFEASNSSDKPSYSILMPPPNVTGILHFGHVLNHTLQDLYIRRKRMQGFEVCWFPGTDHAGIATQSRVEKELKDEKLTRYDLGREKFLERVWDWKDKYGGIIISQLKKLGISCDWNRTLFTLDPLASEAVKEVFVRLFDDGLIYKGKRIINWSPLAQTALSDEEVEFREVKEHLFTLRYRFVGDPDNYLHVATVRPETLFGDIAVAVNPNDERYNKFIGHKVVVPLVGREVPIIADDYADPSFGSGCVKITPAHDSNDFEVGQRHYLEMINTINPDGTLNELTGEFSGVERFKARKLILAKLQEMDLVEKIDDYTHNVGFSQRGGEPVEPYLSGQWFVSMKPLAEKALEVVANGEVKFYPSHWHKTYEHWLDGIRDWCISRQLWWGHRIPVYYTPDGRFTAARNETEARQKLEIDSDVLVTQDEDVLDTWFSSWIWPLTTMKWLEDGTDKHTPDMVKFMPTDLLVTAPDIIFFWVARMIMSNVRFIDQVPFKNVYFTSTIRDGQGRKLSKSLGNSPDPLEIIDKYGADAVRFTMLYLSPLGQDVKMDVDVKAQDIPSMEIGRNFANKIWNAGRFITMKKDEIADFKDSSILTELSLADKWIKSRLNHTIKQLDKALEEYKVNEYSKLLYEFIWRDFCDWYIEIFKVQFNSSNIDEYKSGLTNYALGIYSDILRLLHPLMPFITEEIYHIIFETDANKSISVESVPEADESSILEEIEDEFYSFQLMIDEIRSLRSQMNINPSQKLPIIIVSKDTRLDDIFRNLISVIKNFGRATEVELVREFQKPRNSISSVVRENEIFIVLDDTIDLEQERKRLGKEQERLENNIRGTESKLNNESFVSKAPANIIAFEREKLESMKETLKKIITNIESLN